MAAAATKAAIETVAKILIFMLLLLRLLRAFLAQSFT
jgi:hypothetical protein